MLTKKFRRPSSRHRQAFRRKTPDSIMADRNKVTSVPSKVLEDLSSAAVATSSSSFEASSSSEVLENASSSVSSLFPAATSSSPADVPAQQQQQQQQEQEPQRATLFEKIMLTTNHKLKTYRRDGETFASDLRSIDLSEQKQRREHLYAKFGSSRGLFPPSQPTADLSNSYATFPSSWHCAANSNFAHRTSNLGTASHPFLGKMHPNWVHMNPAGDGSFCFLCGSYPVGGKDHHLSFDRDHIALNFFFFLACAMKREWDAQSVLRESSALFPNLWQRAVSPPIRFSRHFSAMEFWIHLAKVGPASRFQAHKGVTATSESNFHEIFSMSLSGTNWLVDRVQKLGARAAVDTHVEEDGANSGKLSSLLAAGSGGGGGGQQQQGKKQLSGVSSYTLHHQDSAKILAEQQRIEMEQRFGSNLSQADLHRLLTRSGILPEAERLMASLTEGSPYAVQMTPMWWSMQTLHERRLELQALLTAAMDSGALLLGGAATRSVVGQASSAAIGQGEKNFRSDITRVIASTMPVCSANVQAALCQKTWGRTNLSRLYDFLRLEHLHQSVLGRPIPAAPRSGRGEKSAIMRQLITELHAHSFRVRQADRIDELLDDDEDDFLDDPTAFLDAFHSASASSADKKHRNLLSSQLAEMILARLASEAVLTQSHCYMDRAWRVAVLVGSPDAEQMEKIDFG